MTAGETAIFMGWLKEKIKSHDMFVGNYSNDIKHRVHRDYMKNRVTIVYSRGPTVSYTYYGKYIAG